MSDKVIDCRGLACPEPVINTKNAIEEAVDGRLTVIVDNETAKANVVKFLTSKGYNTAIEEKDGHIYICTHKGINNKDNAAEFASAGVEECFSNQAYLITQDSFGHGSPELGLVLMKAFLSTLREVKPLPAALMFVNSGVKLTANGSPVLEQLHSLAGQGVEVRSCGTCLDYYGLKTSLAVGEVTNMYNILETVSKHKTTTI